MTRANVLFDLEGLAVNIETLADDKTLNSSSAPIQSLDPGGAARTLTLPEASNTQQRLFFVANTADAAEVITIADADANTICTPTQDQTAICWSDGTNWHGLQGAES